MGGIPCQIDEMIQNIGKEQTDYYPFEEIINNVETPEEAYKILKSNIIS